MNKQLTTDDIPTILDFRFEMMRECGMSGVLADDWRELTAATYSAMFAEDRGSHFGSFIDGKIVATAGCIIKDDFPAFTTKARRFGWIMDVYVLPEYRKRGLARELTLEVMNWLESRGIQVIKLSASSFAKEYRLYHKLGFTESGEMIRRKPVATTG